MQMFRARLAFLVVTVVIFAAGASSGVAIDWVTVGDPGNACDAAPFCIGAVSYSYRISKYEVTNAQYAEFLNAVAATDSNSLYDTNMAIPIFVFRGGITRTGSSGSYAYSAFPGRENMPVNFVSAHDAARFVNWLANGQPTGLQSAATTEAGTYALTGVYSITGGRAAGASYFLPSENEWYKAAYYDPASGAYFDYPMGTNTEIACASPVGAAANSANCGNSIGVGDFAAVGAYSLSPSPYGTFDQGGNVGEWNERAFSPTTRTQRGGSLEDGPTAASVLAYGSPGPGEDRLGGFRVASIIPEPNTALLVMVGLAAISRRRNTTR